MRHDPMPSGADPGFSIRSFISQHLATTLPTDAPLPFPVTARRFAKGEVFTEYGQTESRAYFLGQGVVQVCVLSEGEEKIVKFFAPGEFFCAYTSLLTQQPADVQVSALTAGHVEVVRWADLQAAYATSLLANQVGRLATEHQYLRTVEREKYFLRKSAPERYADLLARQPMLVQLLPVQKIARYLGIHPESLSRIRRQVGTAGERPDSTL